VASQVQGSLPSGPDRRYAERALRRRGLGSDPEAQPGATPDPDDDYLVALAQAADADCIVSGDMHLTQLSDSRPTVLTPREFLRSLD